MHPLGIEEVHASGYRDHQLPHVRVTIQVHGLMLAAAPESLDENVVKGPSALIDADRQTFALEHFRVCMTQYA